MQGPRCDIPTDTNSCLVHTCTNGATCVNKPGGSGYSCICSVVYRGDRCEIRRDPCENKPCLNGGVCKVSHSLVLTEWFSHSLVLTLSGVGKVSYSLVLTEWCVQGQPFFCTDWVVFARLVILLYWLNGVRKVSHSLVLIEEWFGYSLVIGH